VGVDVTALEAQRGVGGASALGSIIRLDDERCAVTRRERQQQQIAIELSRGRFARVFVMAQEHLAEFPDDVDVQLAAELAARANGGEAPSA
jgi:hypothetical protein